MGSIDNGSQVLSYDYKEEAKGIKFNRVNYKIASHGIYYGGEFTKINDSLINLATMLCFFEDDTNKVGVRIETTAVASVSVTPTTPYIIGRFTWINTENNYMDFLAVEESSIDPADIIFGKLVFVGAVLQTEFDYSWKTWSFNHYTNLNDYLPPFKVEATEPYSSQVTVRPGSGYFVNGKAITIAVDTLSPVFSFPISSNGRTDILCIKEDSSLVIIQGSDLPSAPTPYVNRKYLPIAVVSFPPLATTIRGSYISYLYPNKVISDKLEGVSNTTFQIDQDNIGVKLKNNSGILEVRNAADSAYAIVRGDTPANVNDLVTKQYTEDYANLYATSLKGYINGLTLSNNGSDANNDIDIAVGIARDSSNTYTMYLNSSLTKRLDAAWAAGTNQGGLFSGSKTLSTWYHVFLIRKTSDGTIDAGFSTSITASDIPSGYVAYRRIGSVKTNASNNIYGFLQTGNYIRWKDIQTDRSYATPGSTNRVLVTLISTPPNISVLADLKLSLQEGPLSSVMYIFFGPTTDSDIAPTSFDNSHFHCYSSASHRENMNYKVSFIATDSSSQIYYRCSDNDGNSRIGINVFGWVDPTL